MDCMVYAYEDGELDFVMACSEGVAAYWATAYQQDIVMEVL